ncbi:MAG: YraN family protein [Chloroflexi bacterium]|nr:YraN family protein [Chloroflexota bacterium]
MMAGMVHRTAAQVLGDEAEALVERRLLDAGWVVMARNLRLGRDEIDLLAVDPGPPAEMVVVEVRWRASRDFGLPEETVDWSKRRRLRRAVAALRERLPDLARDLANLPVRVDVVVVEPALDAGSPRIRHHRAIAV